MRALIALPELVGVVGGIAGLVVLFIGALVFVKGSYSKAKIEALRTDNNDLRDRIETLEGSLASERREREYDREIYGSQIKELGDKLSAALTQNQMLADMITQRANVEAIHDLVDQHHKDSQVAWAKVLEQQTRWLEAMENLGGPRG